MKDNAKQFPHAGHVPRWVYGLFCMWLFFFAACMAHQEMDAPEQQTSTKRLNHYKNVVYPAIRAHATHGALILRMGTDFTSMVLSRFGGKDTLFSHCGIISIENDSIFVYHSIGGRQNPGARMKREPLYTFCHPSASRRIGIFIPKLSAAEIVRFVEHARGYFHLPVRFDMAFDLTTDSLQYCSEMVFKCWQYARPSHGIALPATASGSKFVPISSLYHSSCSFKRFLSAY